MIGHINTSLLFIDLSVNSHPSIGGGGGNNSLSGQSTEVSHTLLLLAPRGHGIILCNGVTRNTFVEGKRVGSVTEKYGN